MATYLQGVTDYIPQIQPFQPDLNFLGNILQTKQGRYDAAHKQLSNVYGTMLNSPMLRDGNITNRDNFFKMIQQDIHKMSGVDLSLQQNVDSAQQVFKALYDDQDIVKDMTWTRNYRNQKERANAFKLCVDPEKCGGGWWEGGDQYLDYKAQEFKTATDEDARTFGDIEYVPYQNFQKDAAKWAKEMGFEIKYDDFSRASGYIAHVVNGEAMIQPLAKHFLSVFGSDPKYTKYFEALAYNTRKGWVNAKAAEYGSEEEAGLAYMEQYYTAINNQIKEGKRQSDEDSDAAQAKLTMAEKNAAEQGVQGSETDWLDQLDGYKGQVESINKVKDIYTNAENTLSNMNINASNIDLYLSNFDKLMGLEMIERESINASSAYANLTTEVTYEVDAKQLAANQRAYSEQKARLEDGYVVYDEEGNPSYVPGSKDLQYEWRERVKAGAADKAKTEHGNSLVNEFFGVGQGDVKLLPKTPGSQEGTIAKNLAASSNLAKGKVLNEENLNHKAQANDIIFSRFKSFYLNDASAFQKANIKGGLVDALYTTDKSIGKTGWNKIVKGYLNGEEVAINKVEAAYKSDSESVHAKLSEFSRPTKMTNSGKNQYSTVFGTSFSDITSDESYLAELSEVEKNIQTVTQAQKGLKTLQDENNDMATPVFKAENKNLVYKNLIPELVKAAKYGTYNPINSPFKEGWNKASASRKMQSWGPLMESFYKTSRGKVISDYADKKIEELTSGGGSPLLKMLNIQAPKQIYKKVESEVAKNIKLFTGKDRSTWEAISDKDGDIRSRLELFEAFKKNPEKYSVQVEAGDGVFDIGKKIINNLTKIGREIDGSGAQALMKDYGKWVWENRKSGNVSFGSFIENEMSNYQYGTAKEKVAFDVLEEYNNEDTKKSWLSAYEQRANSWMDSDYTDFRERSTSHASMAVRGNFSPTEPDRDFLSLIKAIGDADAEGDMKVGRSSGFDDEEAFNESFESHGTLYKERFRQIKADLISQLTDPKLATKPNALNIEWELSPSVTFYKKGLVGVKIKVPYKYYSGLAASSDKQERLYPEGFGQSELIFTIPEKYLPANIVAKTMGNNDDIAMRGNKSTVYSVPDGGSFYFTKVYPDPSNRNNYTYTGQTIFFQPDPNNPGQIITTYGEPETGIGKDVDLTAIKEKQLKYLNINANNNRQNSNFKKKIKS